MPRSPNQHLGGHRVEIVAAAPHIGGQFQLAGLKPRRGQINDLLSCYERKFTKLGVTLRLNAFLDEGTIQPIRLPLRY